MNEQLLADLRTHLATSIADLEGFAKALAAKIDQHKVSLAAVEAEIAKVPGIAELKALVAKL